jgi:hypothetical protein
MTQVEEEIIDAKFAEVGFYRSSIVTNDGIIKIKHPIIYYAKDGLKSIHRNFRNDNYHIHYFDEYNSYEEGDLDYILQKGKQWIG